MGVGVGEDDDGLGSWGPHGGGFGAAAGVTWLVGIKTGRSALQGGLIDHADAECWVKQRALRAQGLVAALPKPMHGPSMARRTHLLCGQAARSRTSAHTHTHTHTLSLSLSLSPSRTGAHLNLLQYCFGDIMVGSLPLPPRMPLDLTHVSSCLSHVYCLRGRGLQVYGAGVGACAGVHERGCVHDSCARGLGLGVAGGGG